MLRSQRNIMRSIMLLVEWVLIIPPFGLLAQRITEPTLLLDKPGTFKITKEKLNGQDPDVYGKSCGFTDAESDAASRKLEDLIGIFRKTPVLIDIKGFDCIGHLNITSCNSKFGYGVPCTVYLFFQTWLLVKGKEVKQTIEPPQFRFEVNRTDMFCSQGFNMENYDAYNPSNPAYTREKIDQACVGLRDLFYLPGVKDDVYPGIDRYGDYVVIFNPDQPLYWEQVTIREVFRLLFQLLETYT
jgi:hypothetical protein